jgi:hypothetical protein
MGLSVSMAGLRSRMAIEVAVSSRRKFDVSAHRYFVIA